MLNFDKSIDIIFSSPKNIFSHEVISGLNFITIWASVSSSGRVINSAGSTGFPFIETSIGETLDSANIIYCFPEPFTVNVISES